MKNQNFISNIQLNILIDKNKNPNLTLENIKEMMNNVNNDLLKKVNQDCYYSESHQFTINVIGEFEPYSYDRRKKMIH